MAILTSSQSGVTRQDALIITSLGSGTMRNVLSWPTAVPLQIWTHTIQFKTMPVEDTIFLQQEKILLCNKQIFAVAVIAAITLHSTGMIKMERLELKQFQLPKLAVQSIATVYMISQTEVLLAAQN